MGKRSQKENCLKEGSERLQIVGGERRNEHTFYWLSSSIFSPS
jgi:hypothetical protein